MRRCIAKMCQLCQKFSMDSCKIKWFHYLCHCENVSIVPKILNEMIIPRDNYLQRLIRCRNNGLIKTITGIRRCGKSVLLSKLFYDWLLKNGVAENHIIYIAFDDMSKEKLKNPHEFLDFVNNQISGKGMYTSCSMKSR